MSWVRGDIVIEEVSWGFDVERSIAEPGQAVFAGVRERRVDETGR